MSQYFQHSEMTFRSLHEQKMQYFKDDQQQPEVRYGLVEICCNILVANRLFWLVDQERSQLGFIKQF